jgi:rubrerythrin
MAAENIVEEITAFEQGIDRWQDIEDKTIASCKKILESTDNDLVKTIAEVIMEDSAKHKQALDMITETLNGTVTLRPEDLGELSQLLRDHLHLERDSIKLAQDQLDNSRNFVVRHLLTYLMEDEKKHALLLTQLNDYKRHLYPYA